MNFMISCTLIAVSLAVVSATEVRNCDNTKARLLEDGDVTISNCPSGVCVLKRNTELSVEMKIIPDRDFEELTSDIQGIVLNLPLPFLGHHGTSACPYIYDAEGKNQVGCPLKAGETYIYKNSFKILPVYPLVSLTIHWGMGDKEGDAACFEIPAKIKA